MVHFLNSVQAELWMAYDWPNKRGYRDVRLMDGERYYDFPQGIVQERVEEAHAKWDGLWSPMVYGIDPMNYNASDSETCQKNGPPIAWDTYGEKQFEVWPLPSANCDTIRFTGILDLKRMVEDDDLCELDSDMLVRAAAAEMTTGDARSVAEKRAAQYIDLIRGRNATRTVTNLNGGRHYYRRGHRYDYIRNGR